MKYAWRYIFIFLLSALSVGLIQSNALVSQAQQNADAKTLPPAQVRTWGNLPTGPLPINPGSGQRREETSAIDRELLEELKKKSYEPVANPPFTVELDPSVRKEILPLSDSQQRQYKPLAPDILTNVEGIASDGSGTPPDPDLAVGPSHIVTIVNSTFAIYSKTTSIEVQRSDLAAWFQNVCSGCSPFDPRIAYDPHENHWIMLALEVNDTSQTSFYLVSVSQTSDPTGSWWNWKLDSKLDYSGQATWSDYPDVGFDGILSSSGGAVYITSSQFTFAGGGSFKTSMLNILPKSVLYTGGTLTTGTNYWRAWDRLNSDNSQAFTLRAAKTWGNPGGEYLINSGDNGDNYISLWRVNPTYPPTAVDWTRQASINIGTYQVPPFATNNTCPDPLDTLDNRIYNAIWSNNRIYGAFSEKQNFGSGDVTAIRYLKLSTTSNTAELNVVYGANGFHYFMPAISPNGSDDLTLVFARSSASEYAGLHVTGRRAGASSTEASALLQAGQTCINNSGDPYGRYGDYFGAARDPSDSTKVWVYGEWSKNVSGVSASLDWGTRWSQTRYAPLIPPTAALARLERSSGNFYADGAYFCALASNCFNSGMGADLAEHIDVSEPVEPGDLVEPDPTQPKFYRKARGSESVSGVVSTHPGITLNMQAKEKEQNLFEILESSLSSVFFQRTFSKATLELGLSVRALIETSDSSSTQHLSLSYLVQLEFMRDRRPVMALLGRVPVRASAANGAIQPGDLLVASAVKAGHAVKCAEAKQCEGSVVGKALEALEKGEGFVLTLITSR